MAESSQPAFRVVAGPINLPLARYHIAVVGIGRNQVSLSLRPTEDIRASSMEVSLHGQFAFGGRQIKAPSEIPPSLDALIEAGIVSARTTASDGLELELVAGDLVAAESGRWSVEATAGRRWAAQPGGGIGIWSPEGADPSDESDEPGASEATSASRADSSSPAASPDIDLDALDDPRETPVEIGRGLDLPGPGLVLTDLEVSLTGRLLLSLEVANPADSADADLSDPDVMKAFEFFATLNVGPGTVPPDPEVFADMEAAIERSNVGQGQGIWIALADVEPPAPEAASGLLGALGTAAKAVHVRPDGRLEVGLEGGFRLSSPDWWVRQQRGDRWEGSDGRVVRRRFHDDVPDLNAADVSALGAAWLDHDRTGRETRFWAWERVNDVIRSQPVTGWLLVRRLIAGATDDLQIMSVAAGPLEDFLASHSVAMIDRVLDAARSDPRVMLALGGVWKNAIADEDWRRIENLLGR